MRQKRNRQAVVTTFSISPESPMIPKTLHRWLLILFALLINAPAPAAFAQSPRAGQSIDLPPQLPSPAAASGVKRKSNLEFLNDASIARATHTARIMKGDLPTEGEIVNEQFKQLLANLNTAKNPVPTPPRAGDGDEPSFPRRTSAQKLIEKATAAPQDATSTAVVPIGPTVPEMKKMLRDRQAIGWAQLLPSLIEKEVFISLYPQVLQQMVRSNPGFYGSKPLISPYPTNKSASSQPSTPSPASPRLNSAQPTKASPANAIPVASNQPPGNTGPASDVGGIPGWSPGQLNLWPGAAAIAPYSPKPLASLGQTSTFYLEETPEDSDDGRKPLQQRIREALKKAATGDDPVQDLAALHELPKGPLQELVLDEMLGSLHRDAAETRQRRTWGNRQVEDWKWIQEAFPHLTPAQQWSRFQRTVRRWPEEYGSEILIPHLEPAPAQPVAQFEPLNHGPTTPFPDDAAPLTNFVLPDGSQLNPAAANQPKQQLNYVAPPAESPQVVDAPPVAEAQAASLATIPAPVATSVVTVKRPIRPVARIVEPVPVVRRVPVVRTTVAAARVVRVARPRLVAPVRNTFRRATTRGRVRRGRRLD
jgi:hypothetical protein